jgi:diacylglycerol kinase (ATP)
MKITLIHNPSAGGPGQPGARQLRDLIRSAGHEVRYRSSKTKDWARALKEPADLIAVAGGDGMIGRVLRRMVGSGRPVAVLPMGTANNFSRSLGITGMPIEQHIASWAHARAAKIDAAHVSGPWETTHFVEGLGVGLFAWVMPKASRDPMLAQITDPAKAVAYVIKMLKKRLLSHPPKRVNATLDGTDISGDYVLFEVLNTQFVGPNLYLSPHGHAGDGLLDVVMVTEKERDHLYACLSRWQRRRLALPKLPTLSGRRIELQHGDHDVHVDDRLYRRSDVPGATATSLIKIKVAKGALHLCVPH